MRIDGGARWSQSIMGCVWPICLPACCDKRRYESKVRAFECRDSGGVGGGGNGGEGVGVGW